MNLGYIIEREKGYSQAEKDFISKVFKEAITKVFKKNYSIEPQIKDISPQKKEPYKRIVVFATNIPEEEKPKKAVLSFMDNLAYIPLVEAALIEDSEYEFLIDNKMVQGLCGMFAGCRGFAASKKYDVVSEMQKKIDKILRDNDLEYML